jgi:hypothetical protein
MPSSKVSPPQGINAVSKLRLHQKSGAAGFFFRAFHLLRRFQRLLWAPAQGAQMVERQVRGNGVEPCFGRAVTVALFSAHPDAQKALSVYRRAQTQRRRALESAGSVLHRIVALAPLQHQTPQVDEKFMMQCAIQRGYHRASSGSAEHAEVRLAPVTCIPHSGRI